MIFFVTCCLCQSSIATGRAGLDGAYILGRAGAGERRPVLRAWEGWVGIAGEEGRQLRGTQVITVLWRVLPMALCALPHCTNVRQSGTEDDQCGAMRSWCRVS